MIRKITALVAGLVLSLGVAVAAVDYNSKFIEPMIDKQVKWLLGPMKVPEGMKIPSPAVTFLTPDQMDYMEERVEGASSGSMLALYLPFNIFVKDTIPVNSSRFEAVMLHELVHHFQYLRNHPAYMAGPCVELEAYSFQRKYMTEQGYPTSTWPNGYFLMRLNIACQMEKASS